MPTRLLKRYSSKTRLRGVRRSASAVRIPGERKRHGGAARFLPGFKGGGILHRAGALPPLLRGEAVEGRGRGGGPGGDEARDQPGMGHAGGLRNGRQGPETDKHGMFCLRAFLTCFADSGSLFSIAKISP